MWHGDIIRRNGRRILRIFHKNGAEAIEFDLKNGTCQLTDSERSSLDVVVGHRDIPDQDAALLLSSAHLSAEIQRLPTIASLNSEH